MKNAHLRMGKLSFVRQTRDTITDVSVHLDRLVAETPPDSRTSTDLHVISIFGGDQEVGATIAAAHEGLRFQIGIGGQEFIGSLGEKPIVYRASLQIPGRKRPVRHAIVLSKTFFETTFGARMKPGARYSSAITLVSFCTGWRSASACRYCPTGRSGFDPSWSGGGWWKACLA